MCGLLHLTTSVTRLAGSAFAQSNKNYNNNTDIYTAQILQEKSVLSALQDTHTHELHVR